MNMKIIAVLENIPHNKFSYHYGRYILNSSFLDALMRYSSFDAIHFFVDNYDDGRKALASLRKKPFYKKIKIFPIYLFTEQLQACSYTAIHTNMFMLLSGIADIRNKINPKIPITALTATISYPFYDREFPSLLSLLSAKDAIIVPSNNSYTYIDQMCTQIIGEPRKSSLKRKFRIEKIPYGIEIPNTPMSAKKSVKTLSVLIFNRFSKYDKCDLLPIIPLLKQIISRADSKVQFIMAGDCNDISYLKTILKELENIGIKEYVKVIVSPSEKKKTELLKSADIFLALSDNIQESFGLVLLEAMSYGLPILAIAWNGYRDLVREGDNGMCVKTFKLKNSEGYFFGQRNLSIFPFSHALTYWRYDTYLNSQITFIDSKSFVEKMVKLIEDKSLRTKLSLGALKKVQRYTWKQIIKEYEHLWLKLYHKKIKVLDITQYSFHVDEHILEPFYTHVLEDAVVGLTEEKTYLSCLKRVIRNYTDLFGLLDGHILSAILNELKTAPQSVNDLILKIDHPANKVLFNISWLLKNNFIILME
jgi:glycosyltransferase involved in cell wall biosynthesis